MSQNLTMLVNMIKKMSKLPDEEINILYQSGSIQICEKDAYWGVPGNKPPYICFILKGLFRSYFIDTNGKEYTECFFGENMFMSSYDAVFHGVIGFAHKQALEESMFYKIKHSVLMDLLNRHIEWRVLLQRSAEVEVLRLKKRQRDFLMLDSKARYMEFEKDYPQFINRIQQQHIASYLGISPEALSRIRANLNR